MKASDLTPQSIFYNIEQPFLIGDGSIKGKIKYQIIVDFVNSKNKMEIDIETMDYVDVMFLGNKIAEGYSEWKQFKATMLQLGVNVEELLNKEDEKFRNEFNKNKSIQTYLKKHLEVLKSKK